MGWNKNRKKIFNSDNKIFSFLCTFILLLIGAGILSISHAIYVTEGETLRVKILDWVALIIICFTLVYNIIWLIRKKAKLMKNYIILTLASILIMVVILLFVLIKDNKSTTLKCRSYETAMNVLSNPEDKEVFKKISAIDDVDALRIIVFSTYSAAWPMEAGPNMDFDNLLDDIHLCALKKLISINTDESKYSVDFYKRAFPLDGCRSHLIE